MSSPINPSDSRADDTAGAARPSSPYPLQGSHDDEADARPRSTTAQWATVVVLALIGFGLLGWLLLSDNDDESAPATDTPVSANATAGANATGAQAEALKAAEVHLNGQAMSEENLYTLLRDTDGFDRETASYAVDHLDADFNQLALQVAQQMEEDGTSRSELTKALTEGPEHFTREQAEFAVEHL
ncbi:hypothetical protein CKJ84_07220 [Corynebacterium sp. NML 120412]|uniref:Ltp family lipoprotein n=1 Tax=Corynebacterium sp. NML 120412 TaxID=2029401 RepID=UPI000BAA44F9|nr:Ltp family lipoprotein [Corynebacterium sp. NML 120412]PAT14548.1 hypothetical protein CKJ84_07220 [Corynebacterium sp. NML 120412]